MLSSFFTSLSRLLAGSSTDASYVRRLWSVPVLLMTLLVLIPVVVIFSSWLNPQTDVWQHLIETQLSFLLKNTFILFVGVGVWTLLLGVGLAWLVAMCEFPGRRWLDWALILPLAMPAYVLAFVMLGLFDYGGPIDSFFRQQLGFKLPLSNIRGTPGVLFVMTSVLYPYVYMLARSAFVSQGRSALDNARLLGLGPWQSFFRVALPMARPAIAAGLALALMETLADFGAVSIFNFDTFTTAIYKSWFGLFNLMAAAQLASLLLLFVFLALYAEQYFRKGKVHQNVLKYQRYRLRGIHKWAASAFCFTVVAVAFIIPIIQLMLWVFESGWLDWGDRFLGLINNTITIGVVSALVIVVMALLVAFSRRFFYQEKRALRFVSLGYAFPGTVLAVGVMIPYAFFDRNIWLPFASYFNIDSQQLLLGSFFGLVVAYLIRFFSVAYGPVNTSLERIKPVYQDVSQTLGVVQWGLLKRVYIPMMSPGILTALLLVFVDVMKEMPATLLLRPFGAETLAVRIYEMTSEGEWERAALPALLLVCLSVLPVIILVRRSSEQRYHQAKNARKNSGAVELKEIIGHE